MITAVRLFSMSELVQVSSNRCCARGASQVIALTRKRALSANKVDNLSSTGGKLAGYGQRALRYFGNIGPKSQAERCSDS
jgi:hypothetical protein